MNNLKVSIIIPVYNSERFIAQAIESALTQTYKNLEIIVVNDGSTDNSYGKIKPYLSLIKYITQENKGVSAARNKGLSESTGEFIAFLDADDIWSTEKIEEQLGYLNRYPEVALVHTNISFIDNQGRKRGPHIPDFPMNLTGDCFKKLFVHGNGICTPTVLMRRECLADVGLFTEGISYAEDYELWMRISMSFPIGYIGRPLVKYRIHKSNASEYTADNAAMELQVLKNILKNFPGASRNIEKQLIKKRLYRQYYRIANLNNYEGRKWLSLKFYLYAMLSKPTMFYSELLWNSLNASQRKALSWYKHKIKQSLTKIQQ